MASFDGSLNWVGGGLSESSGSKKAVSSGCTAIILPGDTSHRNSMRPNLKKSLSLKKEDKVSRKMDRED
jgi:hypothetical protein